MKASHLVHIQRVIRSNHTYDHFITARKWLNDLYNKRLIDHESYNTFSLRITSEITNLIRRENTDQWIMINNAKLNRPS